MVWLRSAAVGLAFLAFIPNAGAQSVCPTVGDSLPFLDQSSAGYPNELPVAQGVVELAIRGCILERIAETKAFTVVNAAAPGPSTVPAPGIIATAAVAPTFTVLNVIAPETGSIPEPGLITSAAFSPPVTVVNDVVPTTLPDPGILDGFISALLFIQNNAVGGIAALSCAVDADGDGLTNCQELTLGLDPGSADTDGDGIADGDEDTDGDGIANLAEVALGTYAFAADSDGDGFTDFEELRRGSDPTSGLIRPDGLTGVAYASAPAVRIENRARASGADEVH